MKRKENIKNRAGINEKEVKKTIAKISETKRCFSEKIKKTGKPLARLIKKKRERTQISKIRNEKVELTTDTTEIQRILRYCCKKLYAKKVDNLKEMDEFLEKYNLPRLNQEEIENSNKPVTNTKIKTVIKDLPTNKSPGPDGFTGKFYPTFREELISILLKLKLFKNCRGRKTPKFIVQGHHHPDTKTRQRYHTKKENYRPI